MHEIHEIFLCFLEYGLIELMMRLEVDGGLFQHDEWD